LEKGAGSGCLEYLESKEWSGVQGREGGWGKNL